MPLESQLNCAKPVAPLVTAEDVDDMIDDVVEAVVGVAVLGEGIGLPVVRSLSAVVEEGWTHACAF